MFFLSRRKKTQKRTKRNPRDIWPARLRRAGLSFCVLGLVVWAGAWLWMGGFVHQAGQWGYDRAMALTIDIGFAVENVYVEGRERTDADVLLSLVNVQRGDPIFDFDPLAVREAIEHITWVKSAHVERRLPGTIYIGITERQPAALWQRNKKLSVIDDEGVVLTSQNLAQYKDLIVLVGETAPKHLRDLQMLLNAEPVVKEKVAAASRIGDRRWDLTLDNAVQVKLPEHDTEFALSRLAKVQKEENIMDRDIIFIDMRDPDRMVVRTKPGTIQEYKAGLRL